MREKLERAAVGRKWALRYFLRRHSGYPTVYTTAGVNVNGFLTQKTLPTKTSTHKRHVCHVHPSDLLRRARPLRAEPRCVCACQKTGGSAAAGHPRRRLRLDGSLAPHLRADVLVRPHTALRASCAHTQSGLAYARRRVFAQLGFTRTQCFFYRWNSSGPRTVASAGAVCVCIRHRGAIPVPPVGVATAVVLNAALLLGTIFLPNYNTEVIIFIYYYVDVCR